jgi:HEAT repeat protein
MRIFLKIKNQKNFSLTSRFWPLKVIACLFVLITPFYSFAEENQTFLSAAAVACTADDQDLNSKEIAFIQEFADHCNLWRETDGTNPKDAGLTSQWSKEYIGADLVEEEIGVSVPSLADHLGVQYEAIGTTSPFGWPNYFDHEYGDVLISVPSNHPIDASPEEASVRFGDSPAARDQVQIALSSFESLLPGVLEATTSKNLLRKTAIPSPFAEIGKSGSAILNAYQIHAVAKKIKKLCSRNQNDFDRSCARQKLNDEETYNFSSDQAGEERLQKIKAFFPSCFQMNADPSVQVCEARQAFQEFRKHVFLNPGNAELWKNLACMHEEEGKTVNSTHYSFLALSGLPNADRKKAVSEKLQVILPGRSVELRRGIARASAGLDRDGVTLLEALFGDENSAVRRQVARSALAVAPQGRILLDGLLTDRDASVRSEVINHVEMLGDDAIQFLKDASRSTDSDLRKEIAKKALDMGPEGLFLVDEFFFMNDQSARDEIVKTIQTLGAESLQVAEKLMTSEYARSRGASLQIAKGLGQKGARLIQSLEGDENHHVRTAVAGSAHLLGDEGLPTLKRLANDDHEDVRKAVAEVVSSDFDEKDMFPLWVELMRDPEGTVRAAAIRSASIRSGTSALPYVKGLLDDSDREVRIAIVRSASNFGAEGFEILKKLMNDSDPDVRASVATSLRAFDREIALPILNQLIEDVNPAVRGQAESTKATW